MTFSLKALATLTMTGAATLSLLSCDSIYADPSELAPTQKEGTMEYLDCSDYKKWVYVDLAQGTTTALAYDDSTSLPDEWHIAIHRYDVKTHGGAAYETTYTSLDDLKADLAKGAYTLPAATDYQEDSEGRITTDMSHMMEGYLIYDTCYTNKVMGRWLNVDTSTMPPIYTMTGRVYLLKMADQSLAAILFTAYRHPKDGSGYISFDYLYPLSAE